MARRSQIPRVTASSRSIHWPQDNWRPIHRNGGDELAFLHSPHSRSNDDLVTLAVMVTLALTGLWLLYPMVYVPVAIAGLLLIAISVNGAFTVFLIFVFLAYFQLGDVLPQYVPNSMTKLAGA